MKTKNILCGLIVTGLMAGGLAGCASAHHAKIPKADAQATALAQVPGGTVKDGELEKEHGKWIWSFDIAIPGSPDIKEVAIDAHTGKLVSVETETPAQHSKEKAEDEAKEKKGKGEQEDKD